MPTILERFIASFTRAIHGEMEALRKRLGPFEVPITNGRKITAGTGPAAVHHYTFKIVRPDEKLVPHAECTLRYDQQECLITVEQVDRDEVALTSLTEFPVTCNVYILVIYPWFLYEKLLGALEQLTVSDTYYVQKALDLFGKGHPLIKSDHTGQRYPGLNQSQQQAVDLCAGSDQAFIWGPPGTGKTTTLGYMVLMLLTRGRRVLVTSTTNAAVDNALESLAKLPAMEPHFKAGMVVRVGQTSAPTYGAGLYEVVEVKARRLKERLEHLQLRNRQVERLVRSGEEVLKKIQAVENTRQLGLFGTAIVNPVTPVDLQTVFTRRYAQAMARMSLAGQTDILSRRLGRLKKIVRLIPEKMFSLKRKYQAQESRVVGDARVVVATMTNVYISSLLSNERFDTVIVEEAGMAILPTLFYCACLARCQVVLVGDPQQLPPIIQSRDQYVYTAMGRSIFAVTVPDPFTSPMVVMLDTQYRMHPLIGDLVSDLFYQGRLRHGPNVQERSVLTVRAPFAGHALVVADTHGQATCRTAEAGFSRYNEFDARTCVVFAQQAMESGFTSIAIITPYVEQTRLIRRLLRENHMDETLVECRTVHRFQGNERDMVVLDTVDAPPLGPGILLTGQQTGSQAENLVNVAVSRARGKLVIIADVEYFRKNAPGSTMVELLNTAMQRGHKAEISLNESH
jgi:hypothetical protein